MRTDEGQALWDSVHRISLQESLSVVVMDSLEMAVVSRSRDVTGSRNQAVFCVVSVPSPAPKQGGINGINGINGTALRHKYIYYTTCGACDTNASLL